jgi:hypothetical protein
MKLRNTNPEFGVSDVFEAESKESAAREMKAQILVWAHEKRNYALDCARSAGLSDNSVQSVAEIAEQMTAEYIDGLEEQAYFVERYENNQWSNYELHYCYKSKERAEQALENIYDAHLDMTENVIDREDFRITLKSAEAHEVVS